MADEDIERVETWGAAKKLSDATISEIVKLGFNSMEALALLQQEDLTKTKIPIGQQKLLLKSIKQTFKQPEERPNSDCEHSGRQDDEYVRALMSRLGQEQTEEPSATGGNLLNDNISWQDPQIYFKSLNAGKNETFLDIVDFVNNYGNYGNDEKLLSTSSNGQLVFKSGPVKPKLESVSICQWSMANLAILNKLLDTGVLKQEQTFDYLSYTTRIYQLFSTHDIVSVLFFDREYRRLQNQHGFRWGTDIPHMSTVFLKPKVPGSRLQRTQGQQAPRFNYASHSNTGKEICKRFNGRAGCMLSGCKFEHVCAVPGCSQKHSAATHATNSQPKNMISW